MSTALFRSCDHRFQSDRVKGIEPRRKLGKVVLSWRILECRHSHSFACRCRCRTRRRLSAFLPHICRTQVAPGRDATWVYFLPRPLYRDTELGSDQRFQAIGSGFLWLHGEPACIVSDNGTEFTGLHRFRQAAAECVHCIGHCIASRRTAQREPVRQPADARRTSLSDVTTTTTSGRARR